MSDSIHLIRGRRVGLITNQTGIDERGTTGIDLLASDPRATSAKVKLTALFAPEHGIRGTEDRENLASEIDSRTGVPIHSLYGAGTIAPPDSTLRDLDVLIVDLQDIGTRTWTYVGVMLYAMRAAARRGIPYVVLDRPNPLNGLKVDGPTLDSSLANAEESRPGRPGRAYALYPMPLRHGLTMGEMARFYNDVLGIKADLRVVPMSAWRRDMWFDDTELPWVKPSPNLPNLTSSLIYPALVAFEGSNLSVGRGTAEPFQRIGAPWLDADSVVKLLEERGLNGVRFSAERFTPENPGDRKYAGQRIPGVRISVLSRERISVGRVSAALLWAIAKVHGDSLRLTVPSFDLRFGSPTARQALTAGDDPDAVIDRELPGAIGFSQRARKYMIYR